MPLRPPRRRPPRAVCDHSRVRTRAISAAVAGGIVVGVGGRLLDQFPARTVHWFSAMGAPWLVVAFVVGAAVGHRRVGAYAGGAALGLGVLLYYAIFHWVEGTFGLGYIVPVALGWTAGAVAAGAVFGWAGAAWWQRCGAWATAALAGALVGEAMLLGTLWSKPLATRLLVIEAVLGVACALLLTRDRLRALVLTGGVAVTVVVAELTVREGLRAVGWLGA